MHISCITENRQWYRCYRKYRDFLDFYHLVLLLFWPLLPFPVKNTKKAEIWLTTKFTPKILFFYVYLKSTTAVRELSIQSSSWVWKYQCLVLPVRRFIANGLGKNAENKTYENLLTKIKVSLGKQNSRCLGTDRLNSLVKIPELQIQISYTNTISCLLNCKIKTNLTWERQEKVNKNQYMDLAIQWFYHHLV